MTTPPPVTGPSPADGCAELRAAVGSTCASAHSAGAAHVAATERVRELRRDLVAAQHRLEAAEAAAAPALRGEEKARARDAYEKARALASSDTELAQATATWAQSLDRINRTTRLAGRAVSTARRTVQQLDEQMREATRAEQTTRIRAEAAEAACLDARVRLASCEEAQVTSGGAGDASGVPGAAAPGAAIDPVAQGPAAPGMATPGGVAGTHPSLITESDAVVPLVIVSMVSGDRRAIELAANQVAEHAGLAPAEALLRLQELVDAILSVAAEEGFLVFDRSHRFWSHLSFEESRDVVAALGRLGFTIEPSEGWHAGRVPAPSDLSMALAYAGLDARNMRELPSRDELRALPGSIGVDARAFLARHAPDLTVDHVVQILGRRADQLEPLWDAWGQVRPILLSDRRTLGSRPG